ncbi:MAG: hypothetical protein GX458_11985, partial [Phyllobacteriaceae bacterium]|nr:hypothetical protein [Phyllobacteriaceae bacterium]
MLVFLVSPFPPRPARVRASARCTGARTRALLGVALAALMTIAQPLPGRAEKLTADVATTLEKGYGRLVLTFRDRNLIPPYSVKQNNGVVVLEFSDEVGIDVDQLAARLAPYVTVARRDPEGKSVRIALARQVRVNTMEAGEKLFVDFLPAKWTGAPPPLPPEVIDALAKRAEAAMRAARDAEFAKSGIHMQPKLDFRVGRLPTFTRFAFGWNLPFDAAFSRDGDRVTLRFNRSAPIDFAPIDVEPVAGLVDVFADPAPEGLKIVFTVAPGTDVRGFRERDGYVVDVLHATDAASAGEAMTRQALGDPASGRGRLIVSAGEVAPAAAKPVEKPATPAPAAAP